MLRGPLVDYDIIQVQGLLIGKVGWDWWPGISMECEMEKGRMKVGTLSKLLDSLNIDEGFSVVTHQQLGMNHRGTKLESIAFF